MSIIQGIIGAQSLCQSLQERLLERVLTTVPDVQPQQYYGRSLYARLQSCKNSLRELLRFFEKSNFSQDKALRLAATPMISSLTCGILLLDELYRDLDYASARAAQSHSHAFRSKLERMSEDLDWQCNIWNLQAQLCHPRAPGMFAANYHLYHLLTALQIRR